MTVELTAVMTAVSSFTASLTAELRPADHSRDWNVQWAKVQRDLARLDQPRTAEFGADAIHEAGNELLSFYVQTYHLKDALKAAASSTKVPARDVEKAINSDPDLSLLADVANLVKHGRWDATRKPRSGTVPRIGKTSGIRDTSATEWRLILPIHHGRAQVDGLDLARRVVQAWEQVLRRWSLI